MSFFDLWSRSDILQLIGILIAILTIVVSVMLPEVRRFLRLDGSRRNRKRRFSVFFALLAVVLVAYLLAWRSWIGPKIEKWNVVTALDENSARTASPPARDTVGRRVSAALPDSARQILRGTRTRENLGGGTVVVDLWEAEEVRDVTDSQVLSLFEVVSDSDALSTLAVERRVRVHDVRLQTLRQRFAVRLQVENLTDSTLWARIPKGQVFENKRPGRRVQNLASSREEAIQELPPHRLVEVTVDALCLNRHWAPPEGQAGNLTIFRMRDSTFTRQTDLWASIDSVVHGSGR
jgi:hypothetical protein